MIASTPSTGNVQAYPALVLVLAAALAALAGCGQPVQEDRTIIWSPAAADQTSFQHGADGIFLSQDGQLEKVFSPGDDVIATSTPLWSPDGTHMMFTTATIPEANESRSESAQPGAGTSWDSAPGGRPFFQWPVSYTCWMYSPSDEIKQPVPIFEAACDHSGYVAANLAVRWHPDGERLVFLDQLAGETLGLFEYDLATGERSAIELPFAAPALLFDWTPQGDSLVCLVGSHRSDGLPTPPPDDGIWMGQPASGSWWHVPGSENFPDGAQPSLIEQLRALRPVWNSAGTEFVFVTMDQPEHPEDPGLYKLQRAVPAAQQVETFYEAPARIRDVHWSPDADRIGLVIEDERQTATLQILNRRGRLLQPSGRRPIGQFAGWSYDGRHAAAVVPQQNFQDADDPWAFLLTRNPDGRDAVVVTDGATLTKERPVFSDMRVTFLNWSPQSQELSFWATFVPSYQSWLLRLCGLSLSPGDPAAIYNLEQDDIRWMPVNTREKAQVGHYYLLQRNFKEALRWYEAADSERVPSVAPLKDDDSADVSNTIPSQDFTVFHAYCLQKLGRTNEAAWMLVEFRQSFSAAIDQRQRETFAQTAEVQIGPSTTEAAQSQVASPAATAFRKHLLPDLFIAEVLLSVGDVEDVEQFFRGQMNGADHDAARLSSAIVLSQVLLIGGKHQEYAELATETLAPLAASLWEELPGDESRVHQSLDAAPKSLLWVAGAASLSPLFSQEFVSTLPPEQLTMMLVRWEYLSDSSQSDVLRLAADLVLTAGYEILQSEGRECTKRRLKENPAYNRLVPPEGIEAAIRRARQILGAGV